MRAHAVPRAVPNAAFMPDSTSSGSGLLALACASSSSSVTLHLLTLSTTPGTNTPGAQQFAVVEHNAAVLPEEQAHGSRVVTSLAWLPGCQALAVGCGEDNSVQVRVSLVLFLCLCSSVCLSVSVFVLVFASQSHKDSGLWRGGGL